MAPFYYVSGNTSKRKMRHSSCNIPHHTTIEQCYLVNNYIYDIVFIISCPYVKSPFLFNLSKMLSIFRFSKRFTTKLAPNIVVDSLCKLLNLSKGLYGGVVFFFFDPPPSTPKGCYFRETWRLSFLYDHEFTIWPDWLARIHSVHSNRTYSH